MAGCRSGGIAMIDVNSAEINMKIPQIDTIEQRASFWMNISFILYKSTGFHEKDLTDDIQLLLKIYILSK